MTNEEHIEQLKKLRSFHNGSYGRSINKAIEALEQESKIGHCKDCKHMRYWSHPFGKTIECSKDILLCPTDNDFCSKYERR